MDTILKVMNSEDSKIIKKSFLDTNAKKHIDTSQRFYDKKLKAIKHLLIEFLIVILLDGQREKY